MIDVDLGHLPKHEELRDLLRKALLEEDFQPHEQLPSQNELCRKYNISHNTVREALSSLVHEGLIYRIQGKGTFVAEKKQKHTTIGLVIPHMHTYCSDYFMPLISAIENEAKNYNARIMLYNDNDDTARERGNLRDLLERKVDGIIVYYIGGKKNINCLQTVLESGIPLVLIDVPCHEKGMAIDYVGTDNISGAYKVTSTLLGKGFNRIEFFSGTMDHAAKSDRIEGYRKALSEYGAESVEISGGTLSSSFEVQMEDAYLLARTRFKNIKGRLGIMAINVPTFLGIWRAVGEMELDMSNLGFGCFDNPSINIQEDVLLVKALQPLDMIGKSSVQVVMNRERNDEGIKNIVFQPSIEI